MPTSASRRTALLCLLLGAVTLAVYWPVRHHGFINYDDPAYVTGNPEVQGGITSAGLAWAFFNLHGKSTYWHPVTWVSHMLDCQLFGLNPGAHHLVNVLFHIANTVLVFLVLNRMTGFVWRSALVTGLFALHPLQVDTVAWVTERKNVLSTFFWLLTMWAYVRYAESRMQSRASPLTPHASRFHLPSSIFYLLSLFCFALGLMCKPALVTLPFVLLLVDFWPLRRLRLPWFDVGWSAASQNQSLLTAPATRPSTSSSLKQSTTPLLLLIWEKLPFFTLVVASCAITAAGNRAVGAMGDASGGFSLAVRLQNALFSYAKYLGNAFWPLNLAVFYPYPEVFPAWRAVACSLLLLAISGMAFVTVRSRPYLLVGWFWFLGVLVPMIGLVQAGSQAMADRFAYVPLIGLFIMSVWGLADLTAGWGGCNKVLTAAGVLALGGCVVLTSRQVSFWENSATLFEHTVGVTKSNFLAHYNLGLALGQQGQYELAATHFRTALAIKADQPEPHYNLGLCLMSSGRLEEAAEQYQATLQMSPAHPSARNNLAVTLLALGRLEEAAALFAELARLEPASPDPLCSLGGLLLRQRKYADAETKFTQALRRQPDFIPALIGLGRTLAAQGKLPEALAQFREVVRLCPTNVEAHVTLGNMLTDSGQTNEATACFAAAQQLEPGLAAKKIAEGKTLLAQGKAAAALVCLQLAARLQPASAEARENLGQCYARQGKLEEAVREFQEQLRLQADAPAWYNLALARVMQGNLKEAATNYEQAVKLSPDWPTALNDLAWIRATASQPELRDGAEAVRLAERACELSDGKSARFFGTLDAAYAEAGRFAEAIATAEKARDLALETGEKEIAAAAEQRLATYRKNQPYRQ